MAVRYHIVENDDTDVKFWYGGRFGGKVVLHSVNDPHIRIQKKKPSDSGWGDLLGDSDNYINLDTDTDGYSPDHNLDGPRLVIPGRAEDGEEYRLVLQANTTNFWVAIEEPL